MRDTLLEKGCRLRIARILLGSIFRPNKEYRKRSRAKIIKGALSGWREKGYRLRIVRNHTGSIFRPNNEYWKRSRVKIIEGALPGGPGY